MKSYTVIAIVMLVATSSVLSKSETEKLKNAYEKHENSFVEALFFLPETSDKVSKLLIKEGGWVGFETGIWNSMPKNEKAVFFEELGKEFEEFDTKKKDHVWKQIRKWQLLSAQLILIQGYAVDCEAFVDICYKDPMLAPSFEAFLKTRSKDFPTNLIGSSISSARVYTFIPHLVNYMIGFSEDQQLACFSRIIANISAIKKIQAEQDVAPDGE